MEILPPSQPNASGRARVIEGTHASSTLSRHGVWHFTAAGGFVHGQPILRKSAKFSLRGHSVPLPGSNLGTEWPALQIWPPAVWLQIVRDFSPSVGRDCSVPRTFRGKALPLHATRQEQPERRWLNADDGCTVDALEGRVDDFGSTMASSSSGCSGGCDRVRRLRSRYKAVQARFPKDSEAGRALFGYVRSESRLLLQLFGDSTYKELLRLVRRHRRKGRPRAANRRLRAKERRRRS